MKRFFVGLLAAGAIAAGLAASGRAVRADQPAMIVQPTAPVPWQGADHPHYLFVAPTSHGYGQFVPAQAYAYGWFGVCEKPHAVFHWDFYDHRWIWW
jgi:hypothetical protein